MFLAYVLLGGSLLSTTPDATPTTDVSDAAANALAKLPGHTGFLFTQIVGAEPRRLYGVRDDERFAIGSGFKLFILGTLAEEVNADRRGLDNVMRLERKWVGPPHSEMASWPIGSPVTLQTLALKMISLSDNTATDHLLHLLGRRRVERQMETMGHVHAEWNRPLLSTRETALLRDKNKGLPGRAYQQLDEDGRRKYLVEHFGGPANYDDVDFDAAAYDLAEWYATPMDMARALTWMKINTSADEPAHPLRDVLSVEQKLPHDPAIWPYVGFKGGSEEQLIAANWLLKNRNGRWYTLHVYWNNPDGPIDESRMVETISTILAAIDRSMR